MKLVDDSYNIILSSITHTNAEQKEAQVGDSEAKALFMSCSFCLFSKSRC